jgi:hypothetical protein
MASGRRTAVAKLDWVCCDQCGRWEIFDNCKQELGMEEYDAERVARVEFVCRACVSDARVEKLASVVTQMQQSIEAVASKVSELEESVRVECVSLRETSVKEGHRAASRLQLSELENKLDESRLQLSEVDNKVGEVSSEVVIQRLKLKDEVEHLEIRINEALSSAAAVELRVREMSVNWPTPAEGGTGSTKSSTEQGPAEVKAEWKKGPVGVRGEQAVAADSTRSGGKRESFREYCKDRPRDTLIVLGSSMARGVGSCLERQTSMCTTMSYGGSKIQDIEQRLKNLGDKPQSHVVLMVGTLNLQEEGTEQVMRRYRDLIEEAKQHRYKKVSIVGILRRTDKGRLGGYFDSKRMGINRRLKKMCEANGIGFVEKDVVSNHLSEKDGLHLNPEGQEEVAMAIFRHCNFYLN